MNNDSPFGNTIRSALFVDFDNIYISLENNVGKGTAESFANEPKQWINWLETNSDSFPIVDSKAKRSILLRHCYLNPNSFSDKRPFFVNVGFSVIDCPPVTSQGKTSTDIHMVMDILDTLNHKTHFNEFIIFSADSDFRPVTLRLRAYDRRTTVLSVGPTSQAYIGSVDKLIDNEDFIENALKFETTDFNSRISTVSQDVLKQMADKIYELTSSTGEIIATDIPAILRRFKDFTPDSNWLGFGSLNRMVRNIILFRKDLQIKEDETKSTWFVTIRDFNQVTEKKYQRFSPETSLEKQIFEIVDKLVAEASEPIPVAEAAKKIHDRFGKEIITSHWLGAGSFKNLILRHTNPNFSILVEPSSTGFLYDPNRHKKPEIVEKDTDTTNFMRQDPDLYSFARSIYNVTGAPLIQPENYALIFWLIAQDINCYGYDFIRVTSKIRDQCMEEGTPIARSNISFILKGITNVIGDLKIPVMEQTLADSYYKNILNLCKNAQFDISKEDEDKLKKWFLGEIDLVNRERKEIESENKK